MNKKGNMIEFPEVWDELTQKDWADVLRLRQRIIDKELQVTIEDIRNETARCFLLNRGIKTRYSNDKYFILVHQCAVTLDWLWRVDENGMLALVYRSTVNLIPRIGKLTGPMSHGADMTFGEFKEGVTLIKNYNDTGEEGHLNALCGLLYRRKSDYKKTGYFREQRTNETAMDYCIRGAQIPKGIKWGIMAWFAFFCEYLMTGDFIIDGNTVNFGCLFQSGDKKTGKNDVGLNGIAFTMAESRVFGDLKGVDDTNVLKIMLKLLSDFNKIKELKHDIR